MHSLQDRNIIHTMKISQYFRLGKSQYELDFVDVDTKDDTPLYIDPYAISIRNDPWAAECHSHIVDYFQRVVDFIRADEDQKAQELLGYLHEPQETHLGVSTDGLEGRGIGGLQSMEMFRALKGSRAVQTGFLRDLEDCALMIEGIDRDKISDISTNIIRRQLIEYTQDQCRLLNIPLVQKPSGFFWDMHDHLWKNEMLEIPLCLARPLLLVPKSIVRTNLILNYQEYYNKDILEHLQAYHLRASTSLVQTLKNGTQRVTKKSIKKTFAASKQNVYRYSHDNPDVLQSYKNRKASTNSDIDNETIKELQGEELKLSSIQKIIDELEQIPSGGDDATRYHNTILGAFEAIFYPHLMYPKKEHEIHDGRKRIDFTFMNKARTGFFSDLVQHEISSILIICECKNYSSDPGNEEIDQLSGRFGVNRGKFGILICRQIDNKVRFVQRCRDTVHDGRGHIIALDDTDIINLLRARMGNVSDIDRILSEKLREIIS